MFEKTKKSLMGPLQIDSIMEFSKIFLNFVIPAQAGIQSDFNASGCS